MLPYLMLALAEGADEAPVAALLSTDLDPGAVLAAPPAPPSVPPRVARRLRDPALPARAAATLRAAAACGLTVLTPPDTTYPARLRELPGRPLVLFVRGDPCALAHAPAIAVVGSRTPTPYGDDAATAFAAALARAGVAVWSGLARGVDAAAHRAALAARTPTVAVLAGGLDRVYPPEHEGLARAIVDGGGCLIGELPPGRRARRGHFPRRNRILAGATEATLVVEASLTSGAMVTARQAADGGAEVFAVPGPWASERSQGCHRLLGEGAQVAENPEALLRALGIQPRPRAEPGAAEALTHAADAEAILERLRAGPRPEDLVQRETGLDRSAFLLARFALEQQGRIRSLPGALLAVVSR